MTQLFDVRGNPFNGSLDAITNETITDARAATAVVAALNAEALLDLNGKAVVAVDLRSAAFTGTVVFEGTIDGVNYFGLTAIIGTATVGLLAGAGVVNTQAIVGVSGFRRFRVRVSAYTSGTLTVAQRASSSDYAILASPVPAHLGATATGLVNAAVTLTIPGVAGAFHLITRLQIKRFFVTAGLGAATPTIVTTTNLPGTPAFSFGTSGAIGQTIEEILQPHHPIKASAAGSNTTIVCPAGTDTIWRVSAQYLLGG
jgi:hypothetical protein